MIRIYTLVILGFFVLPTSAKAEAPSPKGVNDAAVEGPDKGVPEKAVGSAKPLHETGARLAKDFICQGREPCLKKNGARLTQAAYTVVDTCLRDPEVPKWVCLGLVANSANESGGRNHPTCGGLSQACVLRCDKEQDAGLRQDCFKSCALEQGIARGSVRWKRVALCNDRGTSRGPFQMKKGRIKWCQKKLGKGFDPFNLSQATECHLLAIKAARKRLGPCGRVDNRWLVAMKRIGAGVLRKVADAHPGRWVPTARGERVWMPASKAVYEQICTESGYGLRGLRYYQACGKRCQLAQRPQPAPTPTIVDNKALTLTTSAK